MITITDAAGTVNYSYHSSGQPEKISFSNLEIDIEYDSYGRQRFLHDPDAGTTEYKYNLYGELEYQIDNKGNRYDMVYDILGRLITKTGPEGQYNYTYDIDTDNKGSLSQETTPDGISSSYTYDNLGRISKTSQNIQGNIFDFSYSFDNFGNLKEETYPGGFTLENMYNERGFLTQVNNKQGSQPLWSLLDVNSKGQPLEVLLGNGLTTYRNYDTYGYLTSVKTGITETTGLVQNYTYQFSPEWGRPEWRNNAFAGQEDFYYDEDGLKLNRLTSVVSNTENTGLTYAANGNIAAKTGLGGYEYQLPQPHAVSSVENTGGILPETRQDITYTRFNKAETITEGEKQLLLTYGTANQRVKTEFYNNQILEKTKYFASNYELEETPQSTRELNYIAGPMGMAAIFVKENGAEQMYYTHSDHLGSLTEITDNTGTLIQRIVYNAWGKRELLNDNTGTGKFLFDRGFTGHEHLDEFGLINMNGRMYDPVIGRFLSPDNYVQNPENPQGYNRYSYCLNNPLVYVDPSGDNPILIPVIIGMAIGGYAGYQIGHAQGATGAELIGYTFFGSVIGGLSGFIGGTISASGGFMANTIGTMVGSTLHSVGMSGISGGMIQPNISFGVASYNFGTGKLGYLGKKGNEWYQDFGYSLGLLANLGDVSSHVLARTKINYARKYYEASLEASTSNIPRPTTEDEWILFANKIAYKDVGGNPGDIISYGQDSPLYSKLSNLTNDELAKTWSLDETFNPGARSSSELFNTGLKLKYYPFKQGIPDAIGLVRANYTMHIIEAGLEFFESLFYADDALYDMHLINSISYIYGR